MAGPVVSCPLFSVECSCLLPPTRLLLALQLYQPGNRTNKEIHFQMK